MNIVNTQGSLKKTFSNNKNVKKIIKSFQRNGDLIELPLRKLKIEIL